MARGKMDFRGEWGYKVQGEESNMLVCFTVPIYESDRKLIGMRVLRFSCATCVAFERPIFVLLLLQVTPYPGWSFTVVIMTRTQDSVS